MGGGVEPSRVGHRSRVTALDGLRGLAALTVVLDHTVMASVPSLADATRALRAPGGLVPWLLYVTPLHALWSGSDAVLLFFVLSGFVLALPAVKLGTGWLDRSYYPRRLLRLYLPVFVAVLLSVVVHDLVAHRFVAGATWWLNDHVQRPSAGAGIRLALLLPGGDAGAFTSVLWSLKYEVLFSLLLPAVLLLPLATRRRPGVTAATAAAALVVVVVGAHLNAGALIYLPGFVLGSMVAVHQDALVGLLRRRGALAVAAVGGVVLLLAPEEISAVSGRLAWDLGTAISFVGACLLVLCCLADGPVRRRLSGRPARWLGSRSYSLYLVHEPIVVSLAFALGGRPDLGVLLVVAVPASLVVADLFWRFVEAPSVELARRVGSSLRQRPATVRPSVG